MQFTTQVAGIPCQCRVTQYIPYEPWRQYIFPGAGPGDCDPPQEEEFEYELLDRKGYPAPWLETKITPGDTTRLQQEYLNHETEPSYA